MRAKELKNFLMNVPDDTEILLRCQEHERVSIGKKEEIGIKSVTPTINDYKHIIVLNPERTVRLANWLPEQTEPVLCKDCSNGTRMHTCTEKGKFCSTCMAVCRCKECGYTDTNVPKPFSQRPNFEYIVEDPLKKK